MRTPALHDPSALPEPDAYVERLLASATLPRVLVRAAECVLFSRLPLPGPALDVGCGDGSFAGALGRGPIDVGVDLWERGLRLARGAGAYRHLVRSPAERLPFRDGAFAAVISNSTLEHTADPRAALREMGRVARPGATCVVTVPGERFPDYLLGATALHALRLHGAARAYGAFMNRVSRHRHVLPAAAWERWLEDAGFQVLEQRPYLPRRTAALLDVSHYLSAPSLLTRAVLGRWVLWPGKRRFRPLVRALARLARPGDTGQGAYVLFHCRKR